MRPVQIGQPLAFGPVVSAPLDSFSGHLLVAGTTGIGKTNAVLHLLVQFQAYGIPLLVIEPVAHEYRALLSGAHGSTVRVYTLGREDISPFRLNPLDVPPGVTVETHISLVLEALVSAMPTFGALPSILQSSLQRVYLAAGWNLLEEGRNAAERRIPTLGNLYYTVEKDILDRGYTPSTEADLLGATTGRLLPLLLGSTGRMLNTPRSTSFESLMRQSTVLELEGISKSNQSLVLMFLLVRLREYWATQGLSTSLRHVTVIEEAHKVMSRTPHVSDHEASGDAGAQTVDMLSDLLAEIRKYGEGLILAEQIPTQLTDGAIKNTNLKLVLRLPAVDDRSAMAGAMNLHDERALSTLDRGQAAFFKPGFQQPKFVALPHANLLDRSVSDNDIRSRRRAADGELVDALPFPACAVCTAQCRHRDVGDLAYRAGLGRAFQRALADSESGGDVWMQLLRTCGSLLAGTEREHDSDALYCVFAHLAPAALSADALAEFHRRAKEWSHA